MNLFITLALCFLIFTLGSSTGTAAEIFVQPGESIQVAVNNANPGDEIVIIPGNYSENIVITKDNLAIISESGSPEDTMITASNNATNTFLVEADNITIRGLSIMGAELESARIRLLASNNCTIDNNEFSNDALGVYLTNSMHNTILNNKASKGRRAINIERSNYRNG